MKEAARVLTIVPMAAQLASEDDEIAGYKWRAGTAIGINYIAIHKHTAYWKDPETFRPERFLEDEIKSKTFLPFGGTVRMCPGKAVAEKAIKTFLIMLFSKFEVELCEPDKEIEYTHHMVTQCSGLKVNLRARNNKE